VEENEHTNELVAIIGLENVKEAFLDIKAKIDLTAGRTRAGRLHHQATLPQQPCHHPIWL